MSWWEMRRTMAEPDWQGWSRCTGIDYETKTITFTAEALLRERQRRQPLDTARTISRRKG